MGKKLLFITTRLFFTTNSGRKLSLYHYCRGLYEKYGYDIYLFTFLEGDQVFEDELKNKPYFIKEVYRASEIGAITKIGNLFFKSLFSKKWPLQCSLYYSQTNVNRIRQLCGEHHFDVVITDMIRTAPYIDGLEGVPVKILDMDDLLSKRYERELAADSDPNFIGQYSKKMSGLANRVMPLLKSAVLTFEIKRLRHAEQYYARLYDHVIFVSDKETKELNSMLRQDKCVTVTTGVDYDYFSEDMPVAKTDHSLSFIGNLEYPPNVDSLKMIVNDVLPYVKAPVKLYVVGKAPDEVRSQFGEQVEFLGMVDDMRPHVKATIIFLSPIAYGSGIKTKILEAMAMGLPVLTNSVGAEGIKITSGVNAIVSDDMKFLAKEIDRLLMDSAECDRIAGEAQRLVKSEYQWNDIWNGFALCGLGE